jgi:glycosyltransferase involved in cell wall biosynthesis
VLDRAEPSADPRSPMRICVVYDCLFPHTVGGAEQWYRNLGERLAADGHQVTYLTLRQWDRGVDPGVPGVDVRVVGPRMGLYSSPGRRRILPPLVFGAGVLWHLLRHGRRYNVVHTASFPYFSLLAAALARPFGRFRLVVDWHEVWSREYWRDYLGPILGRVGAFVQQLCVLIGRRAFCFSRLHAARLKAAGFRGEVTILEGEYAGPEPTSGPAPAQPLVVFAGRHIPEKRADAVVPAVMAAAREIPGLRGTLFGDGPDRPLVLDAIRLNGADGVVEAPGFVATAVVDETLRGALCMLLPSRREGYGMIVVESAVHGVPSIVVREPDNAATELISEGENGTVAESFEPAELAAAIVRIRDAGPALRESTAAWYRRNATRLSLSNSLERVVASYSGAVDTSVASYSGNAETPVMVS